MEKVTLSQQAMSVSDDGLVEEKSQSAMMKYLASQLVNLVILIVIMMYPAIVATELSQEKEMRAMEIILSSTTSNAHFIGKMLSIFVLLIIHFVIYGFLLAGAWQLLKQSPVYDVLMSQFDFGIFTWQNSLAIVVILILGVISYMIAAAFFASLSASNEGAQRSIGPLMLIGIIGFAVSSSVTHYDQNVLTAILPYLPFLSTFIMPSLILAGEVSVGSILLAVFINILAIVALLILTLTFYRSNLLVYSDKNLKQAFQQAFNIVKSERKLKKKA